MNTATLPVNMHKTARTITDQQGKTHSLEDSELRLSLQIALKIHHLQKR